MGAGDYPAGDGPAGSDPVVSTGAASTNAFPVPKFDPSTKDFPLDANGHYSAVHWVDQAVALALTVQLGKVTSDTALGNALRAIKKSGTANLRGQVDTAVRNALKSLLDAGDIELGTLTLEAASFGGFEVVVPYRNLRVLSSDQTSKRIPLP